MAYTMPRQGQRGGYRRPMAPAGPAFGYQAFATPMYTSPYQGMAQPTFAQPYQVARPTIMRRPSMPTRQALGMPIYNMQPMQTLQIMAPEGQGPILAGKNKGRGKGKGKGKEATAAKAAATGATAEDALDCLLAVLPKKGLVPLPQVGALISTQRPGGWAQNFSHLGSLAKFIEANSYYLHIENCLPQPIVSRCDPESQVDDGQPEQVQGAVFPVAEEDAIAFIQSLIPSGQCITISQIGGQMGPGGWNGNKSFSHLAKNLQTFLTNHPEWFAVDLASSTVQHAAEAYNGALPVAKLPTVAKPQKPTGPKASTVEAAAAILSVLPEAGPLALAQVGSLLGQGGWKLNFNHLGNLRTFVENNPELFTVDTTPVLTGGQALLLRGPYTLDMVPEVRLGTIPPKKVRPAGASADMPPAKRLAVASVRGGPVVARGIPRLPRR